MDRDAWVGPDSRSQTWLGVDDGEFPFGAKRAVLYVLAGLLSVLLIWAVVGRLDIVAVASGKLVPPSYVQIVQPAEAGIVREILVKEGEEVLGGQVLMRMDRRMSDADRHLVANELKLRELQLRRLDAELSGTPMRSKEGDSPDLYREVESQYLARVGAFRDLLAGERLALEKIRVAPGTILVTLVAHDQPLQAEVWLSNADVGFINKNQNVKIKVAAYPFQRFGSAQGVVQHIGVDAAGRNDVAEAGRHPGNPLFYRVLVALSGAELDGLGGQYRLLPGMQVTAEIHVGERSVLNYLLSPIQKVASEAGRER